MTTSRMWLRGGLTLLTLIQTVTGAWMLLAPRSFYDAVPTVAMYPPFNEHLFSDLGALNLALAAVLAVSAITLNRQVTCTALAAYLVYTAPHLAFHATHLHGMPPPDAITLTASLALLVLAGAALLILAAAIPARGNEPHPPCS